MDCCRPNPEDDEGYALPAAMLMALVLTVIATGLLARSLTTLRQAREDIERLRIEKGLEGAHLLAGSAVVSSQSPGPYHWAVATEIGPVDIVADEERPKLGYAEAAALPQAVFESLGVTDVAALKARLAQASELATPPLTADLDAAPLWKFCAPALISPLGQALALQYTTSGEPGPGPLPASWRIGEVWRVSIATPNGWRDVRLVRFTGDAQRPTATVARRFFRTTTTGEQTECEERLSGLVSG